MTHLFGYLVLSMLISCKAFALAFSNNNKDDVNDLQYDYSCVNGTQATGTTHTQNTQRCSACNSGYTLTAEGACSHNNNDDMNDLQYDYVCANGTQATGTTHTQNTQRCSACNSGYTLTAERSCVISSTNGNSIVNPNVGSSGNTAGTTNGNAGTSVTVAVDIDNDGASDAVDVDDDNDGLIEIHNLDMLSHVHHNLMGTSYKNSADAVGDTTGAPNTATANCDTAVNGTYLCGYELTRNLNFADVASYASRAINNDWRPNNIDPSNATNAGFPGAGAATGSSGGFAAIFDGNGHSISHLYMRSIATSAQNVGLFRRTESGATIRNLGLINSHIYGGSNGSSVGGLVGHNYGRIIASYTKGSVHGGEGDTSFSRRGGNLPASFFRTLTAVGGLVGKHGGTITASYSASTVSDGEGTSVLGGLVGYNESGSTIRATYVTGDVSGGGGYELVGGLVGVSDGSIIVASYTNNECTGRGLVSGFMAYHIPGGNILDGYRFNPGMGFVGPDGVESASDLSATNVGSSWNDASRHTLGAWVFGNHPPRLRYADYDGSGDTGYCDMFPSSTTCGTTLLPGQITNGDGDNN